MRLRTDVPTRPAHWRWAGLAFAALAVLAGCRPADQITKYTAPKDPPNLGAISDEPEEGEPRVRILGAIAPAGKDGDDDWYFFKIGPTKPRAVERHLAEFDAFVRSLKFVPEGPPSWTVPEAWRELSNPNRIATFRMKKSETAVELAVTRFGGSLLANINRWRHEQAGAEPITEAEIETKCRVLTVDGRRVVIVDVSGPGGKGGMMRPFAK
jgi:hypothetical protein